MTVKRTATVVVKHTVKVDLDGWALNFPDEVSVAAIQEALNTQIAEYLDTYLESIGAAPKVER